MDNTITARQTSCGTLTVTQQTNGGGNGGTIDGLPSIALLAAVLVALFLARS